MTIAQGEVEESLLHTDAVDMTDLEGRLQKYIDEKLVQLQKQLK